MLLALAFGVLQIPLRVNGYLLPVLQRALPWSDPVPQYSAALAPAPYAVLQRTNAVLPTTARILLVTDGTDVRRREYTTYHRALYYLLPRPVTWMSPAPPDGTWESRWWVSAPLTAGSILQVAIESKADYILLLADVPWEEQYIVNEFPGGKLVSMDAFYGRRDVPPQEFASADALWQAPLAMFGVLCIGVLILAVANPPGAQGTTAESFALAWALGAGIVAFAMLLLNVLTVPLRIQVQIISALAVPGILIILWRVFRRSLRGTPFALRCTLAPQSPPRASTPSGQESSPGKPLSVSWLQRVLLLLLALQTAFVALMALGQPLTYWDSWVTWGLKARAIFLEQAMGAAVFADPTRAVTHLDYPLLLPSLHAWLYQWLGAPDDRFAALIALGFFLSLLGVSYSAARRLGADTTRALLGTAILAAMPTLPLLAAEVYADIPLAVYALLTTITLLQWLARGARSALFIALLGAACLVWTKREGFIYLVVLAAVTLLLARTNRRAWQGAVALVGMGILVAGAWWIFLSAQNTANIDFLPLTVQTLTQSLGRVPVIVVYFAQSFISLEWSFVWVLAAFAAILQIPSWRLAPRDILLLAPLLYLAVMAGTYLVSGFVPFENHLNSSGYRLLAQMSPLLVLWLVTLSDSKNAGTVRNV